MVFAEVLGGDEDVVVAGGVEPVADGGPEIARHEGIDEAQLRDGARWGDEWNKLEVGADVGRLFGVAGDFVGLVRRRIGGRLEVEELPTRQLVKFHPVQIIPHKGYLLATRKFVSNKRITKARAIRVRIRTDRGNGRIRGCR